MALYEAMFTQYSICAAQVRHSFFPRLTSTFGAYYCHIDGSLYKSALINISETELISCQDKINMLFLFGVQVCPLFYSGEGLLRSLHKS